MPTIIRRAKEFLFRFVLAIFGTTTKRMLSQEFEADLQTFTLRKEIIKTNRQLHDLIRHSLFVDSPHSGNHVNLSLYARSLYSQNGEDGILIELLRRIGSPVFRSIEMCCGDSG